MDVPCKGGAEICETRDINCQDKLPFTGLAGRNRKICFFVKKNWMLILFAREMDNRLSEGGPPDGRLPAGS